METINKETLWNELMQKYPSCMQRFCAWVDDYKADNNWGALFNESDHVVGPDSKAPKFHDLPASMQFGIFLEFVRDQQEFDQDPAWSKIIRDWFRVEHEKGPLTMSVRVLDEEPRDAIVIDKNQVEAIHILYELRQSQKKYFKISAINEPTAKTLALQAARTLELKADQLLNALPDFLKQPIKKDEISG